MTITLTRPTVTAFDNHGSHWSTCTGAAEVTIAEQEITDATTNGQTVQEWHVTDPTGRPMHVVRIADPEFLDTILAFV